MSEDRSWIPDRLGRWKVEEVLNGGGQGLVVVVTDTEGSHEGEYVAKILRPWVPGGKTSDETAPRKRLQFEIERLKNLGMAGCPNLVRVVDSSDPDSNSDPLFYVMPRYAGSLSSMGMTKSLAGCVDRVLEVVDQVLAALEFMHGLRVSHRDVKPGNIFLDGKGEVVLGDLGLSKAHQDRDGTPNITEVGEPIGPKERRPPEMARTGSSKGGPEADVFLTGQLLYELLSGGEVVDSVETDIGGYGHESPAFDLTKRFPDDKRMPWINKLLRRALVRNPARRTTASRFREAVQGLRNWDGRDPSPHEVSIHEELDEVVAEFLEQEERTSLEPMRAELEDYLAEVCESLQQETSSPAEGSFVRRIEVVAQATREIRQEVGQAPGYGLEELEEFLGEDAVWGKILVGPRIPKSIGAASHFLVGRNPNGEQVVLSHRQRLDRGGRRVGAVEAIGSQDDPGLFELLRKLAREELRTLEPILTQILRRQLDGRQG